MRQKNFFSQYKKMIFNLPLNDFWAVVYPLYKEKFSQIFDFVQKKLEKTENQGMLKLKILSEISHLGIGIERDWHIYFKQIIKNANLDTLGELSILIESVRYNATDSIEILEKLEEFVLYTDKSVPIWGRLIKLLNKRKNTLTNDGLVSVYTECTSFYRHFRDTHVNISEAAYEAYFEILSSMEKTVGASIFLEECENLLTNTSSDGFSQKWVRLWKQLKRVPWDFAGLSELQKFFIQASEHLKIEEAALCLAILSFLTLKTLPLADYFEQTHITAIKELFESNICFYRLLDENQKILSNEIDALFLKDYGAIVSLKSVPLSTIILETFLRTHKTLVELSDNARPVSSFFDIDLSAQIFEQVLKLPIALESSYLSTMYCHLMLAFDSLNRPNDFSKIRNATILYLTRTNFPLAERQRLLSILIYDIASTLKPTPFRDKEVAELTKFALSQELNILKNVDSRTLFEKAYEHINFDQPIKPLIFHMKQEVLKGNTTLALQQQALCWTIEKLVLNTCNIRIAQELRFKKAFEWIQPTLNDPELKLRSNPDVFLKIKLVLARILIQHPIDDSAGLELLLSVAELFYPFYKDSLGTGSRRSSQPLTEKELELIDLSIQINREKIIEATIKKALASKNPELINRANALQKHLS